MRLPGFIGPSYQLSSVNYDCQRAINLYPEINELGTGKEGEVASLIGTPGRKLLANIGTGPHRGAWMSSTGVLYVVSGGTLYSVQSNWNSTAIGTLKTIIGQVSMADNGLQLVVVDGSYGYYSTLGSTSLTQITDVNFLGSNIVSYQDGYFIFAKPNSAQIYLSDLNAITFNAPANSLKEGYPDNIVSHMSSNRILYLFGDQTMEAWFDTGDSLIPFQYIPGTLRQVGCAAKFSVVKLINTVFWLGKDNTGTGIVFKANGYEPQRISTQAVEIAIQKYSDISDAVGYAYQENGHQFYVLTFPTGGATWVFDVATNMWHERAYLNQGNLERDRAISHAFAYGVHVVGDYANGNLYQQAIGIYSDNGNPIPRIRISPHLSKDMNRIFYSRFELDIESGVGLDGTTQGTNPQAMLQWSDDGGHKWSNEHWATFGAIGATKQRAFWNRLGRGRNRVYKITITDPVKVSIIGAEIQLMEAAS